MMFLALAMAYLISSRLQRPISRPILSLAGTAADIAARKDYSIRAPKESEDEIGTLIDSFNDMLAQIQRGEEVIRRSEERYRTLVDNIGLGITLIDADHNIVMPNKIWKLKLLHQNHDSILIQYAREFRDEVLAAVIDHMTYSITVNEHEITIPIEAQVGQSWGELADWERAA